MNSESAVQPTYLESAAVGSQAAPVAPQKARSSVGGLFIAAIVAGFIVFWPVGLALLVWALWRDQITRWPLVRKWMDNPRVSMPQGLQSVMTRKPDNVALARYLEGEQQRLKAEQAKLDELVRAFEAFKAAERRSSDQRDFENFLRQHEAGDTPRS